MRLRDLLPAATFLGAAGLAAMIVVFTILTFSTGSVHNALSYMFNGGWLEMDPKVPDGKKIYARRSDYGLCIMEIESAGDITATMQFKSPKGDWLLMWPKTDRVVFEEGRLENLIYQGYDQDGNYHRSPEPVPPARLTWDINFANPSIFKETCGSALLW